MIKKIKKIFIVCAVFFIFLLPYAVTAKECCVCTISDTSGQGVPDHIVVAKKENKIYVTVGGCIDFGKIMPSGTICKLEENEGCVGEEADAKPAEVETTKLGEEFGGFKDVVLGVTIPSLQFSAPPAEVDAEGNIYISWIGEYLKALYNFAVVMVSIIAVVVIILMGIKIITSGGGPAKADAYKRIMQAVIGLFIAWGSYVILVSINPNLTVFKSLKILFIPPNPFEEIYSSPHNTDDTSEESSTTAATTGSHTSTYADCPLNLKNPFTTKGNPRRNSRTLEFYNSVESIITATDIQQRIVQVADAAAKCQVHFGACGRSASTIYTLAGVGTKDCLTATNEGCRATGSRVIFRAKGTSYLSKVRCDNQKPATPCAKNAKEAMQMVYDKLTTEMGPTWLNDAANKLQPGDYLIIFNANPGFKDKWTDWPVDKNGKIQGPQGGQHAMIFVGWKDDKKAQVIDGSISRAVKLSTYCIKSACTPPASITQITREE